MTNNDNVRARGYQEDCRARPSATSTWCDGHRHRTRDSTKRARIIIPIICRLESQNCDFIINPGETGASVRSREKVERMARGCEGGEGGFLNSPARFRGRCPFRALAVYIYIFWGNELEATYTIEDSNNGVTSR